MAKNETTVLTAQIRHMKSQVEGNSYLIVVCPYSQLTEEIKYIGRSKFQHTVECTVVKIQKGNIKFGDKIKVFFISETKPSLLQLGTLRMCSFNFIEDGELTLELGEFLEYTESDYKYLITGGQ